jgi:hypothetical protein
VRPAKKNTAVQSARAELLFATAVLLSRMTEQLRELKMFRQSGKTLWRNPK